MSEFEHDQKSPYAFWKCENVECDDCSAAFDRINCLNAKTVVYCNICVNWGSGDSGYPSDYCPVVHRCTHPNDWCCWGHEKDEEER